MHGQDKIDAFVVRNTDYYKASWQPFGDGSKLSFNWAASLRQIFWLASRRPYFVVFVALALAACDTNDLQYGSAKTGPLTVEEFESNFLIHLDEPLEGKHRECVLREITTRAAAAGDPETLDPSTVDFLPKDSWPDLDPDGRRIILMQVITTKAMFECPHFDE